MRELVKYSELTRIILCELDERVVAVCREYFPGHVTGLSDPRVECHYADGIAFVSDFESAFDLVIVDSTDPTGPGECLISPKFYRSVAKALNPGGMMVQQTESPWDNVAIYRRFSGDS